MLIGRVALDERVVRSPKRAETSSSPSKVGRYCVGGGEAGVMFDLVWRGVTEPLTLSLRSRHSPTIDNHRASFSDLEHFRTSANDGEMEGAGYEMERLGKLNSSDVGKDQGIKVNR